ncbi:MAG: serine hydrolase [Bacteroidia bacterium]
MILYGYVEFKPDEDRIVNFIKRNPDKGSMMLIHNGELLASQEADRMMPLASTVKIIVAVEYAEQAARGLIDPDEAVPLDSLDSYYVANTDGGAHPRWLTNNQNKVRDGAIPLREVAKGMIRYSSNANTEYLCHRLGLANINQRIDSLGIDAHSEIYYIVSALFVGKEAFPEKRGKQLVEALRDMSMEDYIATTQAIHEKLRTDTAYKKKLGDLSLPVQQVWSDNLPASTAGEYAALMQKLNSKSYLSKEVHRYLDEVMEGIMNSRGNRELFRHAGTKGGSTTFVLTKAVYATDKDGNTTELTYFLDGLTNMENTKLQMSINVFELAVLTDEDFRGKVAEAIGR